MKTSGLTLTIAGVFISLSSFAASVNENDAPISNDVILLILIGFLIFLFIFMVFASGSAVTSFVKALGKSKLKHMDINDKELKNANK